MTGQLDVVVVGAGIVGLATAWRLREADPGLRIVVVDKEDRVGAHQSSHNSGVLHAGVYYQPGSLKARLCTEGKAVLERWCDERGVAYASTGKVIVAVDRSELERFEDLKRRAIANGVPGLREIGPDELAEIEPNVTGLRALHSPGTGVIDFEQVCRTLAADLRDDGVEIRLRSEVVACRDGAEGVRIETSTGDLEARVTITCAGLQSDRVAALSGHRGGQRIVPFRGSWLEVGLAHEHLVRGNVYPVPDPRLPFLGVHFTRRLDGRLWIGPNAVLALDREGYERGSVDPRDVAEAVSFPGLWALGARYPVATIRELWLDRVRSAYLRQARRYVPAIEDVDVHAGGNGIRAQSLTASGEMVDDFVIDRGRRVLHVRNAPSPAATASLAIGRVLADEVRARLA